MKSNLSHKCHKLLSSGPTNTPSSEGKPRDPSATTGRNERGTSHSQEEITEEDFDFFDRPKSTTGKKDSRTVEGGRNTLRRRSSSSNDAAYSSHYRGLSSIWTDYRRFDFDLLVKEAVEWSGIKDFPLFGQHPSDAWGSPFRFVASGTSPGSGESSTPALTESSEARKRTASLDGPPQTPNDTESLESGFKEKRDRTRAAVARPVSRMSTSMVDKSTSAALGGYFPAKNGASMMPKPESVEDGTIVANLTSARLAGRDTARTASAIPIVSRLNCSTQENLFAVEPDTKFKQLPGSSTRQTFTATMEPLDTVGAGRRKRQLVADGPPPATQAPTKKKARRSRKARLASTKALATNDPTAAPALPVAGSSSGASAVLNQGSDFFICQFKQRSPDGSISEQSVCCAKVPKVELVAKRHFNMHWKAMNAKDQFFCFWCEELIKLNHRSSANRHIWEVHLMDRPFVCLCGVTLSRNSRDSIQRHESSEKHKNLLEEIAMEAKKALSGKVRASKPAAP